MKETEIVWIKELFSYYFEKNINLCQNYYKYTVVNYKDRSMGKLIINPRNHDFF